MLVRGFLSSKSDGKGFGSKSKVPRPFFRFLFHTSFVKDADGSALRLCKDDLDRACKSQSAMGVAFSLIYFSTTTTGKGWRRRPQR